ncbi:NAD(P)/FAD-dependent oxidoreductase [Bordetella bronchialis]|uniref:Amino acid dehydrogenase n=1 Tax=Bordetella bronchialis TaxID=463025 RepID=A0A193FHM6_9BORD|nr:FAD-dependent oxidoreductase [Bordetella bronchialis]ANN67165.1 amino acid dehydrogenase [Bordetella bronchialis]ANN72251.1 amino acid dehydrogenase [Bordetella bronchialis]
MTHRFDTLVLGAGIVGVSVAVHLQARGHSVALIDRRAPGQETSHGNGGLIQREGVYPYAFPRSLRALFKYAGNRAPDVRYHATALPRVAPFLARYWWHSAPRSHAAIARRYATLIEHCVAEHRVLARMAGVADMIRPSGWLKVFRDAASQDRELRQSEQWRREYGVAYEAHDAASLRAIEPHLSGLVGALRYVDADTVGDPRGLTQAYARYFQRLGGQLLVGDAMSLEPGWSVDTDAGPVQGRAAVVALGPWSGDLGRRLGYRLPLAVKRGYHMHYKAQAGTGLRHPVLDADNGFLLAPMAQGIRLTTGAEFALRDARRTPVQLAAVEPLARAIFPLGEPVDTQAWMGARPCTPDMMPIVGPAPRHGNLWFACGHAHHGLTLGPVTGRLLAEMMTGAETLVDPAPFAMTRFRT